ncbi:MAG: lipocalin-like domain-containing protein [Hyphomicrobiales bacterium]|nr:MAG: lipocalin-like domain-containing protein [Hyphomicrobiales bacterium]
MSAQTNFEANSPLRPLSRELLVGTWTLVSWVQRRGEVEIEPMGSAPVGSIIYTEDGFVSVSIMRRDRPRMLTGDFVTADAAEKVTAFSGYLGYFGRYELQEQDVLHHISSASYPNWIGDSQRRTPRLDGNVLVLQAAPRIVDGVAVSASLVWRKSGD